MQLVDSETAKVIKVLCVTKERFMTSQLSWGNHLRRFLYGLSSLSVVLALEGFFCLPPTLAAENVVFKVGPFARSFPVQELRTYAETQEASPQLKPFLRRFDSEDQAMLREFLQIKYPLNVLTVDRLLETDYGQKFLSDAAKLTVRRDDAAVQALRAALILGTRSSEGLGVVSFIEAYPSQNLTIDAPQALKFIKANNQILQRLGGLRQPMGQETP